VRVFFSCFDQIKHCMEGSFAAIYFGSSEKSGKLSSADFPLFVKNLLKYGVSFFCKKQELPPFMYPFLKNC